MNTRLWIVLPLAALLLSGCQQNSQETNGVENGMQAIENMEYDKALEEFDKALAAQEDETAALRGKGIAYMGQGNYGSAVEAFDEALSLTDEKMPKTRRDLFYYKASALYKQGSFEEAITVCSEIITAEREGDAYYLRGACHLEMGENDKAKVDFDNAAALSPEDFDLLLNIYSCYEDKSLSADGDPYLQKALAIQDHSEEADYQKAKIYYYLEDFEKAQSLLAGLVEKKDQKAMELMGKVYLSMKDTTHARKIYQQMLESFGETPEHYNGLVLCDLADGDYDAALDNVNKGLNLSTGEGKQELLYNAIVVWEYQGDFEMAKEKAREYVEAYPSDERGQREYTFLASR